MFIELMFMEFMFMEFEDSVEPFDALELFGVSTGWWTLHGCSLFFTIRYFTILKPTLFLAKTVQKTVQKLCIKLPCFDYFSNCMFLYSKNFEKWEVWSLSDVTGFFLLAYFRYFGRNKRYVNYLQNVGILKMWLNHFVSINFDSIP